MASEQNAASEDFGNFDYSKIGDPSIDIYQAIIARYRDPAAASVDAGTMLGAAAALTGEMIRRASSNLKNQKSVATAHEYLYATANLLRGRDDDEEIDPENFPPVDAILLYTRDNPPTLGAGPVLTNEDPRYEPDEMPHLAAAALREDVLYASKMGKLTPEECALACMMALAETVKVLSRIIPDPVAYTMAMEIVVGTVYMPPADRRDAPKGNNMFVSRRIIDAGKEITSILIKQDVALSRGRRHAPTLAAKAGALLGEMVYNADRDIKTEAFKSVISSEAERYLEECNSVLVDTFSEGSEAADIFPSYEDYALNAVASVGKHPYPRHNVKTEEMPRAFPAAEAAMARDAIALIAVKYKLSDWERATAALTCVSDVIEKIKGELPVTTAVRLAMEEAAAGARLQPVDLDDLMSKVPEDARARVSKLRELARSALVCKPA